MLDFVLSTDLEISDNLLVFQPCDSLRSDHFIISFKLLLPSTPSHSRQLPHGNDTLVFDFPKANMPGLAPSLKTLISVIASFLVMWIMCGLPLS